MSNVGEPAVVGGDPLLDALLVGVPGAGREHLQVLRLDEHVRDAARPEPVPDHAVQLGQAQRHGALRRAHIRRLDGDEVRAGFHGGGDVEQDVLDAWERNAYIALKKEYITTYRINWNDKASNLQELAEELNIGLDSFVFLDDNPSERELIKQLLPMVETP